MIPNVLNEKLQTQFGKTIADEISKSYKEKRTTTLRVNTLKATPEEIKSILEKRNIKYQAVAWSDFSLILERAEEEEIRNLDIYKEGKIYLQSLSSQLPPLFLEPKTGESILDMTAAPGGKTTELAALSNNQAVLTAIEKNKQRYERLKYNIEHLGAKKVTVLNTDARHLDEYFTFDKILLDAPCSGSGTLNEKSLSNYNEDLLNGSIAAQRSLIKEATKHLHGGGELIYSTCSILEDENESIIQELLEENSSLELVPLELDNYQELPTLPTKLEGTLLVKPTKTYEGFFVAKIRKKS